MEFSEWIIIIVGIINIFDACIKFCQKYKIFYKLKLIIFYHNNENLYQNKKMAKKAKKAMAAARVAAGG